jgi:hypothetical protein
MSMSGLAAGIRRQVEAIRELAWQYFPDGACPLPDGPRREELDRQLLVSINDLRELLRPFAAAALQAQWSPVTVDNRVIELQYALAVAVRWCNGVEYTVGDGPDGLPKVHFYRVPFAVGDARVILPKLFGDVETALERMMVLALADPHPPPAGTQPQEDARRTVVDQAPATMRPAVYLMNWPEILDAVGMANNDEMKRRLRSLNKKYSGPIQMPRQGGRPKVDKTKLLKWWNGLEERFRESAQKQVDARSTLQAQYHHGRDGTVFPEISGHVRKRRRDSGR